METMQIDIEDYYRRYGPMVLRRCRTLLRNEEDALDAMQQTFVRVLEYADRLTDDAPSSLLYRMATNICLNRIRSTSRYSALTGDPLVYEISRLPDSGGRVEARNLLHRIFRRQKPSTRRIAAMYWLEGHTYAEVAEEVGMSISGVRKRLRELQKSLEKQGLIPALEK
jgi:RNA polymerase sigma-70 factor (ECF subfamily)